MKQIIDPSIWAGLVTLIVTELVLGTDNFVLIAVFAEKLPPAQQDKACVTGLLLATAMRLLLPVSISWPVMPTTPLLNIRDLSFSTRNLIMLFGGFFLLFKATMKLNERLEGRDGDNPTQCKDAESWGVVAQIMVLDTIFFLGSVTTAVGMVDHLAAMMAAVITTISLILLASKSLTHLVNNHPTIAILCLNFLLMVGFSLVAGGFGFYIPKGYLYTAAGFLVMIEALNQLAIFNRRRFPSANRTLHQYTAEAVTRLLSGRKEDTKLDAETVTVLVDHHEGQTFAPQERRMIEHVLNFNQYAVSSIMTSRRDIEHIDLNAPKAEIRALPEKNQHTRLVVTGEDEQEELLGTVYVIDLLQRFLHGESFDLCILTRQPLVFPETLPLLPTLEQLRNTRTYFALVVDEFGSVEGIMTLSDVMETIAGNLPNEVKEIDTRYDIQKSTDGLRTVSGHMPLEGLVQYVPTPLDEKREYHTTTGLLMEYLQRIPKTGEEVQVDDYRLKTLQVENHRV